MATSLNQKTGPKKYHKKISHKQQWVQYLRQNSTHPLAWKNHPEYKRKMPWNFSPEAAAGCHRLHGFTTELPTRKQDVTDYTASPRSLQQCCVLQLSSLMCFRSHKPQQLLGPLITMIKSWPVHHFMTSVLTARAKSQCISSWPAFIQNVDSAPIMPKILCQYVASSMPQALDWRKTNAAASINR